MAVEQEYRGYRIRGLDTFSLQQIMPKGSGDIPAVLSGFWTSAQRARDAIDGYLNNLVVESQNKKKRKTKNDTEESASSS